MHPVLLRSEETSAVLVITLSGAVAALVAKGNGPLSPDGLVSRVLSDPVSRYEPKGAPLSARGSLLHEVSGMQGCGR
jgi:hypothetical protein